MFYDKFIVFYVRFDVLGYIKSVVAYTFWRVSHYAVLCCIYKSYCFFLKFVGVVPVSFLKKLVRCACDENSRA